MLPKGTGAISLSLSDWTSLFMESRSGLHDTAANNMRTTSYFAKAIKERILIKPNLVSPEPRDVTNRSVVEALARLMIEEAEANPSYIYEAAESFLNSFPVYEGCVSLTRPCFCIMVLLNQFVLFIAITETVSKPLGAYMKAFVCTEFGPVDNCGVQEIDPQPPARDQVLIEVKSASLNFPDALMVEGRYQVKPPLPFSPGMDLAGIVQQVGEDVTHVSVGDRVIAFSGVGAFAEMCLAAKEKVVPMPDGMSFDAAAAYGITYATAIHSFLDCGRLQPNETVLVLGAAGGVGLASIEVAKAMGARVIAAASTDEKLTLCRELGADMTINYSDENLRARTLELTDGKGVDVVCDPVGGDYTMDAFRATAWGGRLLVIGFAAGDIPKIPLNYALLSERSIIGVFWGAWAARDRKGQRRNMQTMARWFAEGKINPVIDSTISLSQIPEAMKRLTNRQVKGKVVVKVQSD